MHLVRSWLLGRPRPGSGSARAAAPGGRLAKQVQGGRGWGCVGKAVAIGAAPAWGLLPARAAPAPPPCPAGGQLAQVLGPGGVRAARPDRAAPPGGSRSCGRRRRRCRGRRQRGRPRRQGRAAAAGRRWGRAAAAQRQGRTAAARRRRWGLAAAAAGAGGQPPHCQGAAAGRPAWRGQDHPGARRGGALRVQVRRCWLAGGAGGAGAAGGRGVGGGTAAAAGAGRWRRGWQSLVALEAGWVAAW
jgi:hypothetical protein